jgi:hypothetical protein
MVQFKNCGVTTKSDYNADSAILNISGDRWNPELEWVLDS